MRQRKCHRCGATFDRTKQDPSIWCPECRGATADDELTALMFSDRSGIFGLYEAIADAFDAMRKDSADGTNRLVLVKVIGHAGAVGQVQREHDDWTDRRFDDQHFEASQEMYR